MIIFYIIATYITSWLFTFIGVKLQDKCFESSKFNIYKGDIFTNELKTGCFWWLVIPVINVLAGFVYMIRGLTQYFLTFGSNIIDILFGSHEK